MNLVTTANKQFWKTDEKILFLGEWCLRNENKKALNQLDYEVLPFIWKNKEFVTESSNYCWGVYQKLFVQLKKQLNDIHQVSYGDRYWQLIIGEWLWRYVQIIYDRYCGLKNALIYDSSLTSVMIREKNYVVSYNNTEFLWMCQQDDLNNQLYSQIMRELKCNFEEIDYSIALPSKNHVKRLLKNLKLSIEHWQKENFEDIQGKIALDACTIDIEVIDQLMQSSPDKYYRLNLNQSMYSFKQDLELRTKINILEEDDEFARICSKLIPLNIPLVYLEGYEHFRRESMKNLDQKPQAIISAVGWRFSTILAYYMAEVVEQGVDIIGCQHGGGYGLYDVDSMMRIEDEITDRFITWGWKEKEQHLDLPIPKLSSFKSNFSYKEDGQILFVASGHAHYFSVIQSTPISSEQLEVIADHTKFFQLLDRPVLDQLLVRLMPTELWWDNKGKLLDVIDSLSFDDFSESYFSRLKKTKLVICDNNQTTYLQSIGLNVPTILFWDEDKWKIKESARDLINQLKEVQILHDNPEAAAKFVNQNYNQIEEWWNSTDVKQVVTDFQHRFARTSKDWVNDWNNQLLSKKVLMSRGVEYV